MIALRWQAFPGDLLMVMRETVSFGIDQICFGRLMPGRLLKYIKATQVLVEDEHGERFEVRADALGLYGGKK